MKYKLLLALAGMAGIYYARYIEPEQLQVNRITLPLPNLPKAFDGYKVAQISDIHIDKFMTRERLEVAVGLINEEKPDLVTITGDYVDRKARYFIDDLTIALRELSAPDGVVSIPGNHDYFHRGTIERLRTMMKKAGIIDLSNKVHTIKRGDEMLHIAGLDDILSGNARLDLVLEQLPKKSCAILLAHEPDFALVVAPMGRFDLQLSGHTHGGQVRLPVWGAMVSPRLGKCFDIGLEYVDDMLLYVNRGLGMVTLPFRFNCPPEITIFTLQSPQKQ